MRSGRMAPSSSVCLSPLSIIVTVHIIVALLTLPPADVSASGCGSSKASPYVGFKGPLSTLEHNVAGDVEIVNDCTAQVTMARYDGLAPAAYWWCATSSTVAGMRAGQRANDQKQTSALNGFQTVTIELKEGLTWSDCTVLGLWCEMFDADFGHVELTAAKGSVAPAPATPSSSLPAAMMSSMLNCKELIPGKFNVYWKLDNPSKPTSVTMTLQGVAKEGQWMGFGFSNPSKPEASMIGSDVVVAGVIGGKGFAVDYYLTARTQCNYAGEQDDGVCPDTGYSKKASSNNAVMKAFSIKNGVVSVTFTRPLKASDPQDHPWPVKAAAPAVFAMGPLSEQSNSSLQVVLYHGATRSDPRFKMTLGVAATSCPTPLTAGAAQNSTPPANITSPIIHGRTTFAVVTGSNLNYPNPPGWGYSYHVNDVESPVLRVYRNVMYTFNVTAGPTHPLYITSDIIGGASNPSEKIYAGNANSFGNASAPFLLKWMPDANTPSTVYYMCYVHQKLGWRIEVLDSGDNSECSKTHPYVGFKGKLSQLQHSVSGEVEVLDDCTLAVRKFSYDGQAPAVYLYGGKQDNQKSFESGVRMSELITDSYNGGDLVVRLPPGVSWDMYGAIAVWCEQFKANFGSLELKPGERSSSQGCSLKTAAGPTSYDSCLSLSGSAQGYQVFYSLSKAASGNALVKAAISAQVTGWVGFAFAKTPGKMVGSNAVIVRTTGSGPKADQYYLAAQSVSGVQPPSKLKFMSISTMQEMAGRRLLQQSSASPVVTTFEVELDKTYEAAKAEATPVIYAFGPVDREGNLAAHSLAAAQSASIVLGEKKAGGSVAAGGSSRARKIRRLRSIHGVLVAVGWGVLIPIGIAAAHSFKEFDPTWFHVHVVCQVSGLLLGVAGIAIGLWLGKESSGVQYKSHRVLGIMVLVMGGIQVLLGILRPSKSAAHRRAWELLHHWLGRATTILAIVNIFRGFDILDGLGPETSSFKVAYAVVLGCIVAVGLAKSWYAYLQLPPPAETGRAAAAAKVSHKAMLSDTADGDVRMNKP